jgi:hypothetical protein
MLDYVPNEGTSTQRIPRVVVDTDTPLDPHTTDTMTSGELMAIVHEQRHAAARIVNLCKIYDFYIPRSVLFKDALCR